MPLGEQPIIEIMVRQLAAHGIGHITLAVGYHADLVMAVAGDGSKWGVKIDYSIEEKPLNTIGPLALIENLDEPFLVMNGDLLTDLDYQDLYGTHHRQDCIASIATCKRHVQLPLGVIEYDENKRLKHFQEKPQFNYDVSMGIYVFNPRILEYIPKGEPFGFDQLVGSLLRHQEPINIYPFAGHWLDMGTHEDLDAANEEFEKNRSRYLTK